MAAGGHLGAAVGARAEPSRCAVTRTTPPWLAATCEAGLGAAALLFFPLLVVAPRGIAPLAASAGLFSAGLILPRGREPAHFRALAVPAALLASLLVWGAVSAAWSPEPQRALVEAARLAGIFAASLAMTAAADFVAAPRRLSALLLAGFAVALVMATLDLATHGALTTPFSERAYQPAWLNQASVAFAVLLLPTSAALVVDGRRLAGWVFAALGAATIFVLAGTAAKAALAAGVPFAVLCGYRRAWAARGAAVLVVLAIVTAPLTFARLDGVSGLVHVADMVKLSAGHRLLIWSFVGDRVAEHPLRGWGLDSSRAIPGGKEPIRLNEVWLPLHPHNAPLQLWLELGVPGVVPFALFAGWLLLAFGRTDWQHLYAAAAGGGLAAAFVASVATYGVWQEWWEGTLSFSLFMTLVMARVAPAAVAAR
ncbi:MAG TPA: O-antigen ligase family protein [Stellaceae bacterium]|nr:O-antigen ligase family protein [Stellaceae bacterium]